MPLITYEEVRSRISGRSHLLVGNGFSIACDPIFHYQSLYERAVNGGLSLRAQAVFERLGTNNFEGVMHLLEDAAWVAETYGLAAADGSAMLDDVELVKNTLVQAITASHLPNTGAVSDARKNRALTFISAFHNVFTTNYDLLLYWVNMHAGRNPPFQDGFRADEDDPDVPYVVFSERLADQRGLFFLHGALHLFLNGGELRKHSWARTGSALIDSIRGGLERGEYPLFVAEGISSKKLDQIQRVGYLWYCMDKLARIAGPLVVLGHSLGSSDGHINQALSSNAQLSQVYVGIFGDENSDMNRAIVDSATQIQNARTRVTGRRGRGRALEVIYFDAASARVWD